MLPLFSDRINKSIHFYKNWLPILLEQHDLVKEVISELRTDIYLESNKQLSVRAYARDINGREYSKNIYEFADLNENVYLT